MVIFIIFVSARVLFDGVFFPVSLWVSLSYNQKILFNMKRYTVITTFDLNRVLQSNLMIGSKNETEHYGKSLLLLLRF